MLYLFEKDMVTGQIGWWPPLEVVPLWMSFTLNFSALYYEPKYCVWFLKNLKPVVCHHQGSWTSLTTSSTCEVRLPCLTPGWEEGPKWYEGPRQGSAAEVVSWHWTGSRRGGRQTSRPSAQQVQDCFLYVCVILQCCMDYSSNILMRASAIFCSLK